MAKIKVQKKKKEKTTNQTGSGRSRAVSCSLFCLPGGSQLGAVAGSERGVWTWALPIAARPLPRPGPARKSRPYYLHFTSREGLFFCDSCRWGQFNVFPEGARVLYGFPPAPSREACGLGVLPSLGPSSWHAAAVSPGSLQGAAAPR